MNFDFAIFVALAEEADVFRAFRKFRLGVGQFIESVGVRMVSVKDSGGVVRLGHLVVFNAQGPLQALQQSERVLTANKYHYAFNLGIAGRLSNDVKVGHIVLAADEVRDYSNRIKAVDGADREEYETVLGGLSYPISPHITELAYNFKDLHSLVYRQWEQICKADYDRRLSLLPRERAERIRTLLETDGGHDVPRLFAGPLASGPYVGKSQAFRSQIASINPNALSIDTESAAVAKACNGNDRPSLIVIRGVSDPASAIKNELDEISQGLFRGFAMQSATQLCYAMLHTVLEFPGEPHAAPRSIAQTTSKSAASVKVNFDPESIFRYIRAQHLSQHSLKVRYDKTLEDLIDRAFSYIVKLLRFPLNETPPPATLSIIAQLLRESHGGVTGWLSGPAGSGRSVYSRLLWEKLLTEFDAADVTSPFPVYLNLAAFDQDLAKGLLSRIEEALDTALARDTDEIFSRVPEEQRLVVIIDGYEEASLFRRPLLRKYMRLIKARNCHVFLTIDAAIARGDGSAADTQMLQETKLDRRDIWMQIAPIEIDHNDAEHFVKAFLAMAEGVGIVDGAPEAETLMLNLRKLDVREIDFLIARLVSQLSSSAAFERIQTIGVFLRAFFRTKLRESLQATDDDELDDDDTRSKLETLSERLAFIALTQSGPPAPFDIDRRRRGEVTLEPLKELFRVYDITVSVETIAAVVAAYRIMNAHSGIMATLLAERVLYSIEHGDWDGPNPDYELVKHVYPAWINRSFKHLMTEYPEREFRVLRGAEALARRAEAPALARAHAAYLMGRVSAGALKERAANALHEIQDKQAVQQQGAHTLSRPERLFRRGLSISLAVLGDRDSADRYVRKILENHEEDRINRGFHLEYYGDIPYTPQSGLAHDDSLTSDGSRTIRELDRRIRQILGRRNEGDGTDAQIDIATFCLIVQHRQIHQRLSPPSREIAIDLLEHVISTWKNASKLMQTYICMLRRNLELPNFQEAHFLQNLYGLELEERAGWRNRRQHFTGVVRMQSVAEHKLMAALIAKFYLPDWSAKFEERYEKREVEEMLLVHDLCECFTGDHAPSDKFDPEEERLWGMYIRRLATYERIHGTGNYWDLYEKFYNQSTQSAKVARDIDRIENLCQLYIYRQNLANDAFQAFEIDLISKIETEPGRYVLETLKSMRDWVDQAPLRAYKRFQF